MTEVKRYDANIVHEHSDDPEVSMRQSLNGAWIRYEDHAALQQKLNEALAENVMLKNGAEKCYEGITCIHNSYGWSMSEDGESETAVIDLDSAQFVIQEALLNIETPATDALLNAVRAEGVEMAAKNQNFGMFEIHILNNLARKLRGEKDTTESLAGGK